MAYQTFTTYNQTGLAGLLTYPSQVVPAFTPMVLFGLFIIVFLATYSSQKRMAGRGNISSSFSVSSFFVLMVAFGFSLLDMIDSYTLVIFLAIAVLGTIFLLFGNRDD